MTSDHARTASPVDRELASLGCRALLIVAESATTPDLAGLVRGVHLGASFVVWGVGEQPRLAYATAMERDEAALTGLLPLSPDELGVPELRREGLSPGAYWAEWIERGLAASGIAPGVIALAGTLPSGDLWEACETLRERGWSLRSANKAVRRLRKNKEPWQLEAVRKSAAGTMAAFRSLAELLAAANDTDAGLILAGEPLTIERLRVDVQLTLARHGLEQPHGNIVAAAEEGGVPHNTGTDGRVLNSGETLVVDIFPKGTLYADCTRTFCVGVPTPAAQDAYAAVRRALEISYDATRLGARGWEAQTAVCEYFKRQGYADPISDPTSTHGYVHNLGHGVGFELHEYPSFREKAEEEGVIEVGDILTLEPGLYSPQEGYGIRLEDLCWVGPDGLENLTPLPYDFDPRAWIE